MGVDVVIPWVDGGDPAWLEARRAYAAEAPGGRIAKWNDGDQRFRDWGVLRYLFRGVEKFAPWVGRVLFVTCGQCPDWLNVSNPRLLLVNHADYIPKQYLPTFSSHCIELNLHRIPELSERFVYFNDDTFLAAPTPESYFFRDGLPCDAAIECPLLFTQNGICAEVNDMCALNAHFRKRETQRRYWSKWYSPRYGLSGLVKALTAMPYGKFTGFFIHHQPVPYLKSTYEEVWNACPEILNETCSHRFRQVTDVNQWLMQYWQFASGRFSPRGISGGKFFEGRERLDEACACIASGRMQTVCWNDALDIDDFETAKARLVDAFEKILPERSSFEKA